MIRQVGRIRRKAQKKRVRSKPNPELTPRGIEIGMRRLDAENATLWQTIRTLKSDLERLREQFEEAIGIHNPAVNPSLRAEMQPNGKHFITRRDE